MKIIIFYFLFFYLKAIFLIVKIAVGVLTRENDLLVQAIRKMNVHVESTVLLRLLFPPWAKFSPGIFDAIPQTSLELHQFMLQRMPDNFLVVKIELTYKNKDRI